MGVSLHSSSVWAILPTNKIQDLDGSKVEDVDLLCNNCILPHSTKLIAKGRSTDRKKICYAYSATQYGRTVYKSHCSFVSGFPSILQVW